MNLWSRVSELMWQEAEAPAAAPVSPASREAAGVPGYLQRAVRLMTMGFMATMLASQIVGIRLTAPVDAATPYDTCRQDCNAAQRTCLTNCRNANLTDGQRALCNANCNSTQRTCVLGCNQ